jgi:aromatic ring-opening dioxygenase catalytic subunit (LigB family)
MTAMSTRMPALFTGHGSPTLVDDALWPVDLYSSQGYA